MSRLSQFASDNTAGICPQAWQALEEANVDSSPAYGEDEWTARASDALRDLFETDCEVFFCFNGTAANSLSLAHLCRSFHGVIAHASAHIENHECGGPEFFSHGSKLLLAQGPDGKLRPQDVQEISTRRTDIHYPKPRVLSVTQSTELGTCYTRGELEALGASAREHGLLMHMDGARFANAVAALSVRPRELTWEAGVDVLCFGGTKNGLPLGEAVVFFDRELAHEFDFRCKQAGQLASKMRYLAAPWVVSLESGGWLENARHANLQTKKLGAALSKIPGFSLVREPEVNAVFLEVESALAERLRRRGAVFHDFMGSGTRWMCSWSTTDEDIEQMVQVAQQEAGLDREV